MFLLRLATEVDYTNELNCIQNVAEEIAFYYARYVDFLTLQAQAVDYGSTANPPKTIESQIGHEESS